MKIIQTYLPQMIFPQNMKSEKSLLQKYFLACPEEEREREQSRQPKSSSLKILLSWLSRGRIIWWAFIHNVIMMFSQIWPWNIYDLMLSCFSYLCSMYLLNFLPSILLGSNLLHFNVLCYYPPPPIKLIQ